MRTMNIIRSHQHKMFTEKINKVTLSAYDDKRIILPGSINTLAHEHFRVKKLIRGLNGLTGV